jgi:hypothetical protein
VAATARKGRDHLPRHAGDPAAITEDALHLDRGQHPRAGPDRRRHVADVHRLLGPGPAAGEALAAAHAAAHVARDRLARVAELPAAVAEQQVARALHGIRRRCDAEKLLDRVVVGIQVAARGLAQAEALAPVIEYELRRPHADGRVDQRAAAQRNRLHGGHDGAAGRAQPPFAHRPGHRGRAVQLEVPRREGRPLLEQHDALPRAGELLRHHRAAGARADDDDVRLFAEVAVVLGEDADLALARRHAHGRASA